MSKRFQNWVRTWIEDNVLPHANTDIETDEARAQRLTKKMLAEAVAANFKKAEIDEEQDRVLRQIRGAISDRQEFDIDAYQLAWRLAMEHEDGD
jgi:hypothetical protein